MEPSNTPLVVVFPITTSAFGLRADWFEVFSPKLMRPSFLLITILLVISIGIMVLKRFENVDFAKKVWNLPVVMTIIVFWPSLVIGLKELVDTFNTFLVMNVFGIPWHGFGFPEMGSIANIVAWPTAGLARLLPNLAYWIIYAFYIILFFFYAVLGPLVLAKGILFDEIETFLALVKELLILLLWQTTLVILVAFIMPSIVSGEAFPARPETNFYFLSLILGIMIFFIPPLTRKFASDVERAIVPLGFRWGGARLGLTAFGGVSGTILSQAGASLERLEQLKPLRDRLLRMDEFKARYSRRAEIQDLKEENRKLEATLREYSNEDHSAHESFFDLAKKAKLEMHGNEEPEL